MAELDRADGGRTSTRARRAGEAAQPVLRCAAVRAAYSPAAACRGLELRPACAAKSTGWPAWRERSERAGRRSPACWAARGQIWLDGHGDVTNEPAPSAAPLRRRLHSVRPLVGCAGRRAFASPTTMPSAVSSGPLRVAAEGRPQAHRPRDRGEAISGFEVMGVRGPHQKAGLLSGGNAQKLVIAREFAGSPSLIIAHCAEPRAGCARGGRRARPSARRARSRRRRDPHQRGPRRDAAARRPRSA